MNNPHLASIRDWLFIAEQAAKDGLHNALKGALTEICTRAAIAAAQIQPAAALLPLAPQSDERRVA